MDWLKTKYIPDLPCLATVKTIISQQLTDAEQRGIKKVVEWVEKHWDEIKTYIIDVKDWQVFLRTITKTEVTHEDLFRR